MSDIHVLEVAIDALNDSKSSWGIAKSEFKVHRENPVDDAPGNIDPDRFSELERFCDEVIAFASTAASKAQLPTESSLPADSVGGAEDLESASKRAESLVALDYYSRSLNIHEVTSELGFVKDWIVGAEKDHTRMLRQAERRFMWRPNPTFAEEKGVSKRLSKRDTKVLLAYRKTMTKGKGRRQSGQFPAEEEDDEDDNISAEMISVERQLAKLRLDHFTTSKEMFDKLLAKYEMAKSTIEAETEAKLLAARTTIEEELSQCLVNNRRLEAQYAKLHVENDVASEDIKALGKMSSSDIRRLTDDHFNDIFNALEQHIWRQSARIDDLDSAIVILQDHNRRDSQFLVELTERRQEARPMTLIRAQNVVDTFLREQEAKTVEERDAVVPQIQMNGKLVGELSQALEQSASRMDLLAPQESLAERELELETQRIPRDRLVAREKAQALRDKVFALNEKLEKLRESVAEASREANRPPAGGDDVSGDAGGVLEKTSPELPLVVETGDLLEEHVDGAVLVGAYAGYARVYQKKRLAKEAARKGRPGEGGAADVAGKAKGKGKKKAGKKDKQGKKGKGKGGADKSLALSFEADEGLEVLEKAAAALVSMRCCCPRLGAECASWIPYLKRDFRLAEQQGDERPVYDRLLALAAAVVHSVFQLAPITLLLQNKRGLFTSVLMNVLALACILNNCAFPYGEPTIVVSDHAPQVESSEPESAGAGAAAGGATATTSAAVPETDGGSVNFNSGSQKEQKNKSHQDADADIEQKVLAIVSILTNQHSMQQQAAAAAATAAAKKKKKGKKNKKGDTGDKKGAALIASTFMQSLQQAFVDLCEAVDAAAAHVREEAEAATMDYLGQFQQQQQQQQQQQTKNAQITEAALETGALDLLQFLRTVAEIVPVSRDEAAMSAEYLEHLARSSLATTSMGSSLLFGAGSAARQAAAAAAAGMYDCHSEEGSSTSTSATSPNRFTMRDRHVVLCLQVVLLAISKTPTKVPTESVATFVTPAVAAGVDVAGRLSGLGSDADAVMAPASTSASALSGRAGGSSLPPSGQAPACTEKQQNSAVKDRREMLALFLSGVQEGIEARHEASGPPKLVPTDRNLDDSSAFPTHCSIRRVLQEVEPVYVPILLGLDLWRRVIEQDISMIGFMRRIARNDHELGDLHHLNVTLPRNLSLQVNAHGAQLSHMEKINAIKARDKPPPEGAAGASAAGPEIGIDGALDHINKTPLGKASAVASVMSPKQPQRKPTPSKGAAAAAAAASGSPQPTAKNLKLAAANSPANSLAVVKGKKGGGVDGGGSAVNGGGSLSVNSQVVREGSLSADAKSETPPVSALDLAVGSSTPTSGAPSAANMVPRPPPSKRGDLEPMKRSNHLLKPANRAAAASKTGAGAAAAAMAAAAAAAAAAGRPVASSSAALKGFAAKVRTITTNSAGTELDSDPSAAPSTGAAAGVAAAAAAAGTGAISSTNNSSKAKANMSGRLTDGTGPSSASDHISSAADSGQSIAIHMPRRLVVSAEPALTMAESQQQQQQEDEVGYKPSKFEFKFSKTSKGLSNTTKADVTALQSRWLEDMGKHLDTQCETLSSLLWGLAGGGAWALDSSGPPPAELPPLAEDLKDRIMLHSELLREIVSSRTEDSALLVDEMNPDFEELLAEIKTVRAAVVRVTHALLRPWRRRLAWLHREFDRTAEERANQALQIDELKLKIGTNDNQVKKLQKFIKVVTEAIKQEALRKMKLPKDTIEILINPDGDGGEEHMKALYAAQSAKLQLLERLRAEWEHMISQDSLDDAISLAESLLNGGNSTVPPPGEGGGAVDLDWLAEFANQGNYDGDDADGGKKKKKKKRGDGSDDEDDEDDEEGGEEEEEEEEEDRGEGEGDEEEGAEHGGDQEAEEEGGVEPQGDAQFVAGVEGDLRPGEETAAVDSIETAVSTPLTLALEGGVSVSVSEALGAVESPDTALTGVPAFDEKMALLAQISNSLDPSDVRKRPPSSTTPIPGVSVTVRKLPKQERKNFPVPGPPVRRLKPKKRKLKGGSTIPPSNAAVLAFLGDPNFHIFRKLAFEYDDEETAYHLNKSSSTHFRSSMKDLLKRSIRDEKSIDGVLSTAAAEVGAEIAAPHVTARMAAIRKLRKHFRKKQYMMNMFDIHKLDFAEAEDKWAILDRLGELSSRMKRSINFGNDGGDDGEDHRESERIADLLRAGVSSRGRSASTPRLPSAGGLGLTLDDDIADDDSDRGGLVGGAVGDTSFFEVAMRGLAHSEAVATVAATNSNDLRPIEQAGVQKTAVTLDPAYTEESSPQKPSENGPDQQHSKAIVAVEVLPATELDPKEEFALKSTAKSRTEAEAEPLGPESTMDLPTSSSVRAIKPERDDNNKSGSSVVRFRGSDLAHVFPKDLANLSLQIRVSLSRDSRGRHGLTPGSRASGASGAGRRWATPPATSSSRWVRSAGAPTDDIRSHRYDDGDDDKQADEELLAQQRKQMPSAYFKVTKSRGKGKDLLGLASGLASNRPQIQFQGMDVSWLNYAEAVDDEGGDTVAKFERTESLSFDDRLLVDYDTYIAYNELVPLRSTAAKIAMDTSAKDGSHDSVAAAAMSQSAADYSNQILDQPVSPPVTGVPSVSYELRKPPPPKDKTPSTASISGLLQKEHMKRFGKAIAAPQLVLLPHAKKREMVLSPHKKLNLAGLEEENAADLVSEASVVVDASTSKEASESGDHCIRMDSTLGESTAIAGEASRIEAKAKNLDIAVDPALVLFGQVDDRQLQRKSMKLSDEQVDILSQLADSGDFLSPRSDLLRTSQPSAAAAKAAVAVIMGPSSRSFSRSHSPMNPAAAAVAAQGSSESLRSSINVGGDDFDNVGLGKGAEEPGGSGGSTVERKVLSPPREPKPSASGTSPRSRGAAAGGFRK